MSLMLRIALIETLSENFYQLATRPIHVVLLAVFSTGQVWGGKLPYPDTPITSGTAFTIDAPAQLCEASSKAKTVVSDCQRPHAIQRYLSPRPSGERLLCRQSTERAKAPAWIVAETGVKLSPKGIRQPFQQKDSRVCGQSFHAG